MQDQPIYESLESCYKTRYPTIHTNGETGYVKYLLNGTCQMWMALLAGIPRPTFVRPNLSMQHKVTESSGDKIGCTTLE